MPFLLRLPRPLAGANGRELPLLLDAPDIMPTLLGLCGLPVPPTVQGRDWSAAVAGTEELDPDMSCLLKVPVRPPACRRRRHRDCEFVRPMRRLPWLVAVAVVAVRDGCCCW